MAQKKPKSIEPGVVVTAKGSDQEMIVEQLKTSPFGVQLAKCQWQDDKKLRYKYIPTANLKIVDKYDDKHDVDVSL